MKQIPLTRGMFAIVDDDDYENLLPFKWSFGSSGYAVRDIWPNKKRVVLRMHRVILNASDKVEVDHINGNRLDNRKENLRICTRSQNCRNSSIRSDNSSGYKGVSWFKPIGKWRAYININGKHKNIGYFSDIKDAARAYNDTAKEVFGEFAKLNNI